MPGPISVYDGNAYAGDAQIGHLGVGADRLITFATDLDVTGRTTPTSSSEITRVRLVRGVLVTETRETLRTDYAFENGAARDRTIWIEHPNRAEYAEVTPEPVEVTDAARRFELRVPAGESAKLSVAEQRAASSTARLLDTRENFLAVQIRAGRASPELLEVFRRAGQIQDRALVAERTIGELEAERGAIASDQSRIRENLARVDRSSEQGAQLAARYIAKLTEQETRLDAIVDQIARLRGEAAAAREELTRYLESQSVN